VTCGLLACGLRGYQTAIDWLKTVVLIQCTEDGRTSDFNTPSQ